MNWKPDTGHTQNGKDATIIEMNCY
jgi:hypothetical protein